MRFLFIVCALIMGVVSVPATSQAQDIFVRQGDKDTKSGGTSLFIPRSTKTYKPSPGSGKKTNASKNVFVPEKSADSGIRRGTSSRNNLDEVQRLNIADAQRRAERNSKIIAQRSVAREQERARVRAERIAAAQAEQARRDAAGEGELPPEFRTDAASIDVGDKKVYVNKPQGDKSLNKPTRLFNVFE